MSEQEENWYGKFLTVEGDVITIGPSASGKYFQIEVKSITDGPSVTMQFGRTQAINLKENIVRWLNSN